MTLRIAELPDETSERAAWIERELVGSDLRAFVAELVALGADRGSGDALADPGAPGPVAPGSLDAALGGKLTAVLESGLEVLSPEQVQTLIEHPRLLLELQRRVGVSGGEHWQALAQNEAANGATASAWERLSAGIDAPQTARPLVTPLAAARGERTSRRLTLGTFAGMAAALLVVAVIWFRGSPSPTWGFDRSGVLTAQVSGDELLDNLANAAGDWSKKRPESPAALRQRLAEFRHGCDTLIAAPLPQLANADRTWLKGKCADWAGKIDGHIAALDARQPLAEVQTEADKTVEKLIEALRARAEEVRGAA